MQLLFLLIWLWLCLTSESQEVRSCGLEVHSHSEYFDWKRFLLIYTTAYLKSSSVLTKISPSLPSNRVINLRQSRAEIASQSAPFSDQSFLTFFFFFYCYMVELWNLSWYLFISLSNSQYSFFLTFLLCWGNLQKKKKSNTDVRF